MAPSRPRSLRQSTFNSKRNISPGPPSPTFSDTTNADAMNFGRDGPEKIITRADLKTSMAAYEQLMATSANYRNALAEMSKATAAYADAMEACSSLKGPSYEAGTRLQASSGVHHLIGNHWTVLADTIDKKFEKPLRQHLDGYKSVVNERSASYERALREKSRIIKETETRNMKRGKDRNLQNFRQALSVLQRQVDDLDDLKVAHYREIIEHEEEVWNVVQSKICIVVRSTMDVFDRFTSKASDPVIELMLQAVPDPFDSYGPPQSENHIFSILPPLSIMTSSTSATPVMTTPEMDPMDGLPSADSTNSRHNSWTGFPPEATAWASPATSPPRSKSPPTSRNAIPPRRRSDSSNLRSVLTAIDEKPLRQSSHSSQTTVTERPTNGGTSQSTPLMPERKSTWSWASPFGYGQSPYSDTEGSDDGTETTRSPYGGSDTGLAVATHAEGTDASAELTPRNSTFMSIPPPDEVPKEENAPAVFPIAT
ncbi:hypothetical protein CYLTODRAFT_353384 [Cylindrobasidium torrendii FP15055 ss-10]|uniref:IMD domain-containing protein n=1 Tax=Cylindrobasidium torrendii FP15055 ss-10 TaxID=1314674 RepID=A0A0D7BCT6_9AGAR|nr:hypothetical protein CYLTODRAFT_353384 [Cylindrobasidium torrendii FP15055 ss-10]